MFDVQEELKKLPPKPGVYIMHDERDAIIYVGKAVNLHNRVRSYFRKIVGRGPQIDQMVKQISQDPLREETAEGQGAIFWPLYQRTGSEEHHRAAE